MSEEPREVDLTPHRLTPRATEHGIPRSTTVVVGYVGEALDEGYVRVYLNRTMTSYYEVKAADVVATQQIDRGDPDSPRRLWLASDAQVRVVRIEELSGPASFVDGALRGRFGARQADLKVQPPWGRTEIFFFCPTKISVTEATTQTWPCAGTDVWPQCPDCCE